MSETTGITGTTGITQATEITQAAETQVTSTGRRSSGLRRHIAITVAALAIAAASLGAMAPAPVAAASGTATSHGFVCGPNHWVRTNFPNMTAIGNGIESVYFRTDLYKWTGTTWAYVATRGYYAGASNANGNLPLGYVAGVPFYWLLNGGVVYIGAVFNNLSAGYYRTAEYYQWQNGATASQWSKVAGSTADFCYVS